MDILPYQRVGPLTFGMPAATVETIMGPPAARSKNFLNEVKLVFPGINVEFSQDAIVEVTIGPSHDILINGKLILKTPDGRNALLAMSRENYLGNGTIILLDIGIAISDELGAPFPITAFARGRMDSVLSTYERLEH